MEKVSYEIALKRRPERLPQILQALREEGVAYRRGVLQNVQVDQVRAERTSITLRYLDYLEEEFQVLLEA